MENAVKDASITVRIPQGLKTWARTPGALGKQSLSETVSYALELARSQEKGHAQESNGSSTPDPTNQEPAKAEGFALPADLV